MLANTDWLPIRECPCPLWFVRSGELPRLLRVLVAVDPRHTHAKPAKLDDRLLQAARVIERRLGARISLVHAYETPASVVPGMMMEPLRLPLAAERTREFVASTMASVAKLADKYGLDSVDRAVREGVAHNVIPAEARRRRATDHRLYGGARDRSRRLRRIRRQARWIQSRVKRAAVKV